jgi:hypothetical protein
MRIRVFHILCACLLSSAAVAQDMPLYRLTCIPTQLVFLELPIALERQFGRHTIGLTVAYRPDLVQSGAIQGRGLYHLQNYWNFTYRTATGGLIHKYYLRDRFGLHLETQFLMRVWWFDEKQVSYDGGDENFHGLRSELQEVAILKLLIGKSIIWHRKDAPSHVLEFFAGPSIRFKRLDFTTHEGWVGDEYRDEFRQQEELWLPGLQVGVRFGIGLGR